MMEDFISILRCPLTNQPLMRLRQDEVHVLNKRIDQGDIRHCHGKAAIKTLVDVLKVRDHEIFYPIVDDIFCLLPHLALFGDFKSKIDFRIELDEVKQQLQSFYDEIGWQKEQTHFIDAVDSEDLRLVSQAYIQKCHSRVKQYLPAKGKYLLDVASGPIQYEDYLSYSENFEYRVCADISIQGLREAKKKLKSKGRYVLCDMTCLPFFSDAMDGVVSLHTIYHIPKDEQLKAFQEIYRVLKPQGRMAVVYSWGNRSLFMNAVMLPWKIMSRIKRRTMQARGSQIYFYTHNFNWFYSELMSRYPVELKAWRSVNVPFLKKFIHPLLLGKFLLKIIYWLEEKYPYFMGRVGAYPLMVFEKK